MSPDEYWEPFVRFGQRYPQDQWPSTKLGDLDSPSPLLRKPISLAFLGPFTWQEYLHLLRLKGDVQNGMAFGGRYADDQYVAPQEELEEEDELLLEDELV